MKSKKQLVVPLVLSVLIVLSPLLSAKFGFVVALCGILVYLCYLYFVDRQRYQTDKKSFIFIVLIGMLVAILIAFNLRFYSGEDNWYCKGGKRYKHGNPTGPQPEALPCD